MSSKKFEELFNLPSSEEFEDAIDEKKETKKVDLTQLREIDKTIDKIDIALPSVRDLEASDEEMDDLALLSKQAFNDLLDLGMSVDPRFGAQVLQVAASMMTNSITAKTAKIDKKLKMVELQLRKAALDQKERALASKKDTGEGEETTAKGVVMDRNALLKEILEQAKEKKK
jgi:uncharacterized membrane protein